MLVEHTFTMNCTCPMNKMRDTYEVTFRMTKLMPVETILKQTGSFSERVMFQEDLTELLAHEFQCEVERTNWKIGSGNIGRGFRVRGGLRIVTV